MGFPKESPYKIWRGVPRGRGRAGARPSRMARCPQRAAAACGQAALPKLVFLQLPLLLIGGASSISTIRKRHELNHHAGDILGWQTLLTFDAGFWYNIDVFALDGEFLVERDGLFFCVWLGNGRRPRERSRSLT